MKINDPHPLHRGKGNGALWWPQRNHSCVASRSSLPKKARDFLARFEADLDPSIANDQRYEFRINLVPKLGPKTAAERALTFVRESDLKPEERAALATLGRTGSVIIREQTRPVASADMFRRLRCSGTYRAKDSVALLTVHFIPNALTNATASMTVLIATTYTRWRSSKK